MPRDYKVYLDDIIDAIGQIESYAIMEKYILFVLGCLISFLLGYYFSNKQTKELKKGNKELKNEIADLKEDYKIGMFNTNDLLNRIDQNSRKMDNLVEIISKQEDVTKKQLLENGIKSKIASNIPAKLENEIVEPSTVPIKQRYFELEGIVKEIKNDSSFRVLVPNCQLNNRYYFKGDYISIAIDEQNRLNKEIKKGVAIVLDIFNKTYELLDEKLEEELLTSKFSFNSSNILKLKVNINDKVIIRIFEHVPFRGIIVKNKSDVLVVKR
jgi:hypothetical protein